jgi:two-component system sensor histidine kinase DegS
MDSPEQTPAPRRLIEVIFLSLVVVPTLVAGALELWWHPGALVPELIVWALLIAIVELLPVPAWRGLSVSLGLPVLMAMAFTFGALAAGVTAFVGTSDPRELKREISPLKALFNRCQVALSVAAASSVFHSLVGLHRSRTWQLILAAMLASSVDYLINSGLVATYMTIWTRLSPWRVVRELRIGRISEFLVSYLGLGVLGLALAQLYGAVSFWAIPTFLAPLLFARQMFFRTRSLEEAHKELQEREQVLKVLSNTMAEERQDERTQIAGYLHDDLAQILFRLSIQVDVAKRLLEKGEVDKTFEQIEKIRQSKQDTSDRIRGLIRELHRSPLGAKGVREAIESFIEEQGRDSGVMFHTDVQEVALPPPIALLVYKIAGEGVLNSLKHAQASNMWIIVREGPEDIELQLRDDGLGFDTSAAGPEGHFGMVMMRQRAKVGGGSFEVVSAPGEGTTITVRFPTSLLQVEPQTREATTPGPSGEGDQAHASPGTSASPVPAGGDSRETVRA